MDVTLKFLVRVKEQEHEVPVRAKLVIGSHLMDREVEVYALHWPDGANIQPDELQQVVRGYVFAFLNLEGTSRNIRAKASSLSHARAEALRVLRRHRVRLPMQMRTFQDLAEKLKMDVTDLMRQCNAKTPPSKTLVKGLARELDINESYLEKLADEVRKELGTK